MDFAQVLQLVGQLGFPIVIASWLLYQQRTDRSTAARRESDLVERIRKLEETRINEIKHFQEATISALASNTQALKEITQALRCRPCLSDKEPEPTPSIPHIGTEPHHKVGGGSGGRKFPSGQVRI
jgi:hypothetical protein